MNLTHDVHVRHQKIKSCLERAYADHKKAMERRDTAAGLKAAAEIMKFESMFTYPIATFDDFN
jgi:hypothetical protein